MSDAPIANVRGSIRTRYCTGHLGDIGVPLDDAPMDFSAQFEANLGGRWYTFDARNNYPRIGRMPPRVRDDSKRPRPSLVVKRSS